MPGLPKLLNGSAFMGTFYRKGVVVESGKLERGNVED